MKPSELFLLFFSILLLAITVPARSCVMCKTGNLTEYYPHLNNPEQGRRWNFNPDWLETDCYKKKYILRDYCEGSCLTIIIENKTEHGYVLDVILMDCGWHVITKSTDFNLQPEGYTEPSWWHLWAVKKDYANSYHVVTRNVTKERDNARITYRFSADSVTDLKSIDPPSVFKTIFHESDIERVVFYFCCAFGALIALSSLCCSVMFLKKCICGPSVSKNVRTGDIEEDRADKADKEEETEKNMELKELKNAAADRVENTKYVNADNGTLDIPKKNKAFLPNLEPTTEEEEDSPV